MSMKILTENKAELLKIFLTNPERSFFMQEIGRALGKKPGVFQRILNNFVEEGVLESEYRANARYFWINKNYPLYQELKSIVFKTVGLQGSVTNILKKIKGISFAFIYGSYAKDKEHKASDFDVMIIGDINEGALITKLDQLESQIKREINYNLYTLEGFKSDVRKKSSFLMEIMADKKIMLIGSENELRTIYKG